MNDTEPLPAPPDGPDAPSAVPADEPPARRRSTVPIWIGLAVLVVLLGVAALALSAPDDGAVADPSSAPSSSVVGTVDVSIDGTPRAEPIPEGTPIPDWTAPTLNGEAFAWRERTAGPTVLAIWAPWCPHCQAELPRLSAAIERHPGVSLVTIATAVDETTGPTPQEYMDREDLDFLVALDDEEGTLGAGLGIQGFPTTYFVDASGQVLGSVAGELDPDGLEEALSYLESLEEA